MLHKLTIEYKPGSFPKLAQLWSNPGVIALAFGAFLVIGVNLFARQSLPENAHERVDDYLAANMPAEADLVYEQLLEADPLNIDLHYAYLTNHFKIPQTEGQERDPQPLTRYYEALASEAQSSDIGLYSLGLIQAIQHNYLQALDYYLQVSDRDQKYLNSSIGYIYLKLGDRERAERYFYREIASKGNLGGAVSNLVGLYLEGSRWDKLQALVADPSTAPFVAAGNQRWLAFKTGDLGSYLISLLKSIQGFSSEAILSALIICLAWLIYLHRIDVFDQNPFPVYAILLLLGAASAPLSGIPRDILSVVSPASLAGPWHLKLMFSILHIGWVEEVAKLLPVLLVVALIRRDKEPSDLIIYGSVSALGFATIENALYFTAHGPAIATSRFLYSTVMHMCMTAIVCYTWAKARYIFPGGNLLAVTIGLGLASLVHGFFNFFILFSGAGLNMLSPMITIWMIQTYARILRNSLNFSPYYSESVANSPRLKNHGLLLSAVSALLLIGFLHNHFNYATEIANQQLASLVLPSLPGLIAVLISLGGLSLAQGKYLPTLAIPRPGKGAGRSSPTEYLTRKMRSKFKIPHAGTALDHPAELW